MTLDEIRAALNAPKLELELRDEWSSSQPSARTEIRAALSTRTGLDLSDLSLPPRPKAFSISISHCTQLGGFALVEKPARLGLDTEVADRVSPRIVERVSRADEVLAAPSPAHLWTAKESTFKTLLGPGQPKLISDICIGSWLKIRQVQELEKKTLDAWNFSATSAADGRSISGKGLVFTRLPVVVALFYLPTST